MINLEDYLKKLKAAVFLEFVENALMASDVDKKGITFIRTLVENGCPIEAIEKAFYSMAQSEEEYDGKM